MEERCGKVQPSQELRGVLDLRGGANDLEIDRGRQEKKPRAERICKVCKDGVEDEVHIVARCNAYQEQRSCARETEFENPFWGWSSLLRCLARMRKTRNSGEMIGRFVALRY